MKKKGNLYSYDSRLTENERGNRNFISVRTMFLWSINCLFNVHNKKRELHTYLQHLIIKQSFEQKAL